MRQTARVAILSILLNAGILICVSSIAALRGNPGSSVPATRPVPAALASYKLDTIQQPQNTVEQSYKNIKVLKGLPDSQLFSVMNFMRASLGVSCAYCHANSGGDNWNFESDEKPAKQTARRMIQMVYDINKGNRDVFGGGAVTCFTCHRANIHPIALPSLPVPLPEGGPGGLPSKENSTLPTARQIVDKYVQAIGGSDAIRKLNSRSINGVSISWDGKKVPFVLQLQAPNKILFTQTSQQGERIQGFDGATGWVKTGEQTRTMNGAEMARLRLVQAPFDLLAVTEALPEMRVTGKEKVNNQEAFVIERAVGSGQIDRFYFDANTGLLLRVLTLIDTILTRIPEQIDFEDYKEVEGARVPFMIRNSFVDPWNGTTIRFSEIKSAPVDDTKFEMPKSKKQ
ncbi:MAG TPA: c-type cytochrome [Pyrinomonadaceae bacterium]|nr:c-type cytochrome [Pyrinomonadaceae bacterium]